MAPVDPANEFEMLPLRVVVPAPSMVSVRVPALLALRSMAPLNAIEPPATVLIAELAARVTAPARLEVEAVPL